MASYTVESSSLPRIRANKATDSWIHSRTILVLNGGNWSGAGLGNKVVLVNNCSLNPAVGYGSIEIDTSGQQVLSGVMWLA